MAFAVRAPAMKLIARPHAMDFQAGRVEPHYYRRVEGVAKLSKGLSCQRSLGASGDQACSGRCNQTTRRRRAQQRLRIRPRVNA